MGDQQERRPVGERREELIDATIAVLASEGFGAATTRRITERAGLALGAFHYAFDSKDDLLRAVIERFSDGIEEVLLDATGASSDHGLEQAAERVIRSFWAFIEATPDLQLAQYELTVHALREPSLRELAELQYERMARAVRLVLERVPDVDSDTTTVDDLARYLAATMDGLILHHVVQRDTAAAERRIDLYLRTMPALADAVLDGSE